MPNHVTNRISITGNKSALIDLFNKCFSKNESQEWFFDFDKLIPQPPEVIASLDDDTHKDQLWYEWRCDNWKTKWGAYDLQIIYPDFNVIEKQQQNEKQNFLVANVSNEPFDLLFTFDTAWSVPTPIFVEMAKRWPSLEMTIDSFDEGWNFYSKIIFKDAIIQQMIDKHPNDEQYKRTYNREPEHMQDEDYHWEVLAHV